ncbi:uncharacterized protein LOC112576216 [Pomacea canaliculata]|uniref:uncharacterized protein LOC112576216 n=1 Tax=Pomacea canaliculata TaxID=400727 RepID=UPI000D726198|nr:uncharacterized protein LOC112576216 [Pomacea canaliculata]XP_025114297.1 uncharacterized protein LOC112576216 [Pomacea canaliculata]
MDMRKVRVFPEDKSLAFQSPANNEVESPPLLERCRRSTIRRETQHSITSTYKPPPPWQVKIIIFIIAIVAFLVTAVLPAPSWFVIKDGNCTARATLWSIQISGVLCSREIRNLSFTDYIWISRILISVVAIQTVITSLAMYWYGVRMHNISILADANDSVSCAALYLLGSLVELTASEGQNFSLVTDTSVYGITFHVFVVTTGVAVFAAVLFSFSMDWDDFYENAYD